MSLTVLSRVRVSPVQQVPVRGQALCTEGFKLPANNGDRGPGSVEAPQVPASSVPSVNGWWGVSAGVPMRGQLHWEGAQVTWGAPPGPAPFSRNPGLTHLQCHLSSLCRQAEQPGDIGRGLGRVLEAHPQTACQARCPSLPLLLPLSWPPAPQQALHSSTRGRNRVTGSVPPFPQGPIWLSNVIS